MLEKIEIRFLLCHIHSTSARLRFLGFHHSQPVNGAQGYVCAPEPLPPLVTLLESPEQPLSVHPAAALQQLIQQLQIQDRQLSIVPNFKVWVEAPRRNILLFLAADTSAEPFPPPTNAYWLELPESWHISALERDLLREAYEALLC